MISNKIAMLGSAIAGDEIEDCFRDARHAAAQMAGLALLGKIARDSFEPGHPLATALVVSIEELEERLGRIRPKGPAMLHAHFHLVRAARLLRSALHETIDAMRLAGRAERAHALTEQAMEELKLTTRILTGLELVDLGQGCCAAHRPSPHNQGGGMR